MTLTRTAALLAIAAGCLLPTACTSSNHTASRTATTSPASTATTGQATKTSFTARASAICQHSNRQLGDAARQAFGNRRPTRAAWRTFMTGTVLPIITQRLDTLAALPHPSSIAGILSAGRSAISAARNHPQLLSPASPAPFGHFDHLTAAYGIPTCGVGG